MMDLEQQLQQQYNAYRARRAWEYLCEIEHENELPPEYDDENE